MHPKWTGFCTVFYFWKKGFVGILWCRFSWLAFLSKETLRTGFIRVCPNFCEVEIFVINLKFFYLKF